ncbi:hypothetical protein [Pseudomonas sp. NPDC007930]|uniref:hypothetical protein n=1 Tax=Pseudomonas sp. NPDC007930 TaxID=3364417 RepID=UPI0036F133B7
MHNSTQQQGGFGNDQAQADPLDPLMPGQDPEATPGEGNLADHEGEIPLDPEDDAPAVEDDPLADDNTGNAAI